MEPGRKEAKERRDCDKKRNLLSFLFPVRPCPCSLLTLSASFLMAKHKERPPSRLLLLPHYISLMTMIGTGDGSRFYSILTKLEGQNAQHSCLLLLVALQSHGEGQLKFPSTWLLLVDRNFRLFLLGEELKAIEDDN
jgi:hypothetical protein